MSPPGLRRRGRDRRCWREAELLALDLETTSADPATAAVLSAGWVPMVNGRVRLAGAGYTTVAHPGEVPVTSVRIHRLLPGDLADGVAPDDLPGLLRPPLDGRVLVAHGAGLERGVLSRLGVTESGVTGEAVVDTLAVVRAVDARAGRTGADPRLPAAARRWDVPAFTAHHAFHDALTTALLLLAVATRYETERGRCTVDDLLRLSRIRG